MFRTVAKYMYVENYGFCLNNTFNGQYKSKK